jgi:hypothetical protein
MLRQGARNILMSRFSDVGSRTQKLLTAVKQSKNFHLVMATHDGALGLAAQAHGFRVVGV